MIIQRTQHVLQSLASYSDELHLPNFICQWYYQLQQQAAAADETERRRQLMYHKVSGTAKA
jgi:hypothetical protein